MTRAKPSRSLKCPHCGHVGPGVQTSPRKPPRCSQCWKPITRKPLKRDRGERVWDTGRRMLWYWVERFDGPTLTLVLPFPISANVCWRNYRGMMVLSKDGRAYRKVIGEIIRRQGSVPAFGDARLKVHIMFFRGDNHKYDLRNFDKALLDALQVAGVFQDDSQIDDSHFVRGPVRRGNGCCVVQIREIKPEVQHGNESKRKKTGEEKETAGPVTHGS
jgi:crossover junction endodeoxyribonuclease RusA